MLKRVGVKTDPCGKPIFVSNLITNEIIQHASGCSISEDAIYQDFSFYT